MINKKLEKKLERFLIENNRKYYKESIKYLSLRKCGSIDGKIRNFHIVSYLVPVSNQPFDGDSFFYASFDETKHHLVEIVGPQSYENFEE